VSYVGGANPYRAATKFLGKRHSLGNHPTAAAASDAVEAFRLAHHGEFYVPIRD
jgi:hypothetical protein